MTAEQESRSKKATIGPEVSMGEAMGRLDQAGTGVLLVCDERSRLTGILTDGDIRRAILRGMPLSVPVSEVAVNHPVVAAPGITQHEALHVMNERDINQLPVVDSGGIVVGLILRRDVVSEQDLELTAVIMAGGYGTRLRPLTDSVPKPMLPIGDKPILELTIEKLKKAGIRKVNLTTHYLADSIEKHFGDGSSFGVSLNYVNEDNPLGTAGGLKLMAEQEGPLLVINGDILTGVPFQDMLAYHRSHKADVTIGVRKYDLQVPYGVIECSGPTVTSLREKPAVSFFINAGVYLLEPATRTLIPDGKRFDMTDLIQTLLAQGRRVVSFPIVEYWLDVGQHADYVRAQEDIKNGRI